MTRSYEDGILQAVTYLQSAAANTDDEYITNRLNNLAEDILEEAPLLKATWKQHGAYRQMYNKSAEELLSLQLEGKLYAIRENNGITHPWIQLAPENMCGYVYTECEMGVGYDRRIGPVVWYNGYPAGGHVLYAVPKELVKPE